MKSQVFKSAWQLVKVKGFSLSEALRMAWSAAKVQATVFITTSWNGKRNVTFVKDGSQASTLDRLAELLTINRVPNTAGARFDYGKGTYNGD